VSEHEALSASEFETFDCRGEIGARKRACGVLKFPPVGAGLRATSGRIFGGCNVENATTGLRSAQSVSAIVKSHQRGEPRLSMPSRWVRIRAH